MTLPRGGLPDITFADSNPTDITTRSIRAFESITGETLAPADPRRLFILLYSKEKLSIFLQNKTFLHMVKVNISTI